MGPEEAPVNETHEAEKAAEAPAKEGENAEEGAMCRSCHGNCHSNLVFLTCRTGAPKCRL